MKMLRNAMFLGLLALAFGSSGCLLKRTIVSIEDHPDKNVTLMETNDFFFLGGAVDQFWQCGDSNGTLTCNKVCGSSTDLACFTRTTWGGHNLQ